MVARPDIAHRIERVVCPLGAGRTKPETQMFELARINETGWYRHGTTDPHAEFHGEIVRLPQQSGELAGAGLQQAKIRESAASRIEAIEHDAVGPQCQRIVAVQALEIALSRDLEDEAAWHPVIEQPENCHVRITRLFPAWPGFFGGRENRIGLKAHHRFRVGFRVDHTRGTELF